MVSGDFRPRLQKHFLTISPCSIPEEGQLQCHPHRLECDDGGALVLECRGESAGDGPLLGQVPAIPGGQGLSGEVHPLDWLQPGRRGGRFRRQAAAGVGHQAAPDNGP